MLIGRHYQNAYVTPDIDAAVAAVAERFPGAGEPYRAAFTMEVETADQGRGPASLKLALFQFGALQLELIEPVDGNVGLYRDAIRPGRVMSFHHIAMQTSSIADVRREGAAAGLPPAIWGASGDVSFVYLDARATLGHYLEYCSAPQPFWRAIIDRAVPVS